MLSICAGNPIYVFIFRFLSLARLLKDSGSESVGGQRSTAPVEQTSRVSLLTSLIGIFLINPIGLWEKLC